MPFCNSHIASALRRAPLGKAKILAHAGDTWQQKMGMQTFSANRKSANFFRVPIRKLQMRNFFAIGQRGRSSSNKSNKFGKSVSLRFAICGTY